jgi:hypothetical protein
MSRPARAIWRAEALRDDALAAERAGVLVDDRTVAAEVLVERDAFMRQTEQAGQPALALLDRLVAQILAVHLEQVERAEQGAPVAPVAAYQVEHGESVVVANDRLPVDDARFDRQCLDRFGGKRETVREVMAITREQPDAASPAVRQDAETVVFDFVNPAEPRGRLRGRLRQARLKRENRPIVVQSAPKVTRY